MLKILDLHKQMARQVVCRFHWFPFRSP